MHAGLIRRAAAFSLVARFAGGHDIFPTLFSTLNDRNHVIESELVFRVLVAAILANVLIAQKDVGAGEADNLFFLGERDIGEQSQHGWDPDCHANRSNFLIRFFNDFYFPLKQELDRPLPGDDMKGFK
jgi:hypothetical protein